jgi:hypothetical protein
MIQIPAETRKQQDHPHQYSVTQLFLLIFFTRKLHRPDWQAAIVRRSTAKCRSPDAKPASDRLE